jgi:thioredoxin reductase
MVITEEGKKLEGLNVVLAIGVSEQTYWPEWAKLLKNKDAQSVGHIFDSSFSLNKSQEITIIGGGISAAHLAIKLSKQGRSVHLITRHPFRIVDFDSDPAWLGPKNQLMFREEASYQKRRAFITDARHRGSMPRDIYIKLIEQTRKNNLTISKDEIQEANIKDKKIILYGKTAQYETETIVLATGFSSSLPGKEWLTPLINKENLQCSDCGYPIVSSSLQWSNNLYVVGALAELEIGPISRNISGARQAAEQIVKSL